MKLIIVATFVIIALSSTIKCEAKAFFLFPFRFDFKQDKTNDGAVKTLVYSSPFTGKTYNLDYEANWSHVTFPPLPPPKAFNWDFNWNFNHGDGSKNVAVNKETTEEPSTTTSKSTTVSSNTGSYSGQHGHKNIDVKWSFDFNHGASATTSASSTEKPIKDENEQVKEEVLSENETILDDDDGGKAQDNDINPTSQ